MTELTGMTPQELSDWCKAQGMPAFRGKQISAGFIRVRILTR